MGEESYITSDPSAMERLDFRDIPLNLMEGLEAYSVGLIGVRLRSKPSVVAGLKGRSDRGIQRCGSGTLVRSGGRHFILTAAHCARELAEWDEIGLVLTSYPSSLTIPVSAATFIGESQSAERGPDLAFLPITPDKVAVIMASTSKIFWNLDRQEAEMLKEDPKFENGLWALMGTPDVYSVVHEPHTQELKLMAYSVAAGWPVTNGVFDYVHVPMPGTDSFRMFKGVSGGGLWQAEIERRQDGSLTLIGTPRLEGCAFYGFELQGKNCVVIRCHGRRSIYHHGLHSLRSEERV